MEIQRNEFCKRKKNKICFTFEWKIKKSYDLSRCLFAVIRSRGMIRHWARLCTLYDKIKIFLYFFFLLNFFFSTFQCHTNLIFNFKNSIRYTRFTNDNFFGKFFKTFFIDKFVKKLISILYVTLKTRSGVFLFKPIF